MTCSGISGLVYNTVLPAVPERSVLPNTEAQNVLPERSERAVVGVPASLGYTVALADSDAPRFCRHTVFTRL